jgi:hypothetical protein
MKDDIRDIKTVQGQVWELAGRVSNVSPSISQMKRLGSTGDAPKTYSSALSRRIVKFLDLELHRDKSSGERIISER